MRIEHTQAYLDRLAALEGVQGAFLFDSRGKVLFHSTLIKLTSEKRNVLALALSQSLTDLSGIHASPLMDIDLFFGQGRLVIKGVPQGGLCIVCDRQVNNSLLNIALEEWFNLLLENDTQPAGGPRRSILDELIQVAQEVLGEHASKVISILETADDEGENLLDAIAQAEKLTRLFIDKDQAGHMAQRMRDLVQRSR
jgi:hypothetical protein